ncbi:signal transduction histidine kinase [Sphingomonas insulae]|uniref:histidine kinase n=1 Tax=Sphingomonas insulae TaxID=424800 RepID=A0ABN1HWN4_9SPHN|nr:HAMP domain-containing sensor histidine kinase [Sphingomonas insulae]NIJ28767.1 signal transduction histidine kinase [Sphingomonas insulae]
MKLRSIQGRMLLLSAIAILAALGIAGWAIGGVLERVVTEGIDRRLDAEIALLASVVDRDGRVDRAALAQRAGALEAGRGWRWRIETPQGAIGSADRPLMHAGPHPPGPVPNPGAGPGPDPDARPGPDAERERGPEAIDGEDAGGHAIHARRLTMGAVTLFAAAPRAVIARPLRDALVPLLAALAILAVLLAAATWVQLRLGLRPLGRMRAQVAAIRAGKASRLDEDQPVELRGLATELNALAADREAALATARQSAANLAHALKTPVATLALGVRDDPAKAAQVARIDATIRHHLSRARAGMVDARASTPVAPAIADLVQAIGRLHAGRGLSIATDSADVTAAIDPQDFDELLGNLLDNAARYAGSRIWVGAHSQADARWLDLIVADDGPGIPVAERERVTQPGVRLDERGEGHGFGLAIVRELAELHGGRLTLSERPGGGLEARVALPARH